MQNILSFVFNLKKKNYNFKYLQISDIKFFNFDQININSIYNFLKNSQYIKFNLVLEFVNIDKNFYNILMKNCFYKNF